MDKDLRNQQRAAALDPEEVRAQEKLANSHWRAGRHMDSYQIFNQPCLGLESQSAKALIAEMVEIQRPFLNACPKDWGTKTVFSDWTIEKNAEDRALGEMQSTGKVLTSLCVDHAIDDQKAKIIAQIPFLRELEVRGQVGSGDLNCLRALEHLESFAQWIKLSGESFSNLDMLAGLKQFLLYGIEFEPHLAEQVVRLPTLNELTLSIEKGPSAGLVQLKDAPALTSVRLDAKRLNDSQLCDFINTAPLTELYLNEVALSQQSFDNISTKAKLKTLHIDNDPELNSRDLSGLAKLNNLHDLKIEDCSILSYQLDFLAELPKLTELALTGPTIDNSVIEALSQLHQLKTLDISNSTISNRALRRLQKLRELRSFSARNTRITSDGIRHFAQLPKLETVDWRGDSDDYQRERDGSLVQFLNRIPPETEYFLPGDIDGANI